MQGPESPTGEGRRQAALDALRVLDTAAEERFDRITRLVQRLLGVPIALVSLVDRDRQWFKSRQGLDATETPRDVSFCGHAILGDELFLVPDASRDPRFADNPLVVDAPDIRFYAGAPLHAPGGERVGTLCAIDRVPRELSPEQRQTLVELSACVESELERTRLLDLAAQLRIAEERTRSIVENVVEGILTIDASGSIRELNPAAERLFGYRREELVGRNVKVLMPEPYQGEHDGYLSRYASTGERRIIGIGREVSGLRRDGSVFPLELAVGEMTAEGERFFTGVVRDVSQRKDAEARLHAVTAMRQAILDSASVAIISTDTEGVIRTFNRTAERWLGFSASELVGHQTPGAFHDPLEVARRAEELSAELGRPIAPGFEAFVARARLGATDERAWTYVRKDGGRLPVQLSVTALRDAAGEITGFLGTAVDLTERQRADRLKSEFISTVSHELRTPLTSIRGALGLVMGKSSQGLPEKARKLLEIAARNSERLTLLINDLLDLEKIEAGSLDFELQGLDLVALAGRAIEDNDGVARQHQVRLALRACIGQALVRGDPHRLQQVFANLLSNAIKFSAPGGDVEVSVEVPEGGGFRVTVRDHGSGIPEAFRDRIFQRFAQADSSDSREKGGTGLGLSITRAIVERHEGRIHYETESGVGTAFHVDLPALEETRQAPGPGPRVLLCEDNPDVASVLESLLHEEGLVCDVATTARGARQLLAAAPYRLLLLDLTLPDGDGLDLLRDLRAAPATASLPVVVVTGRAREGARSAIDASALAVVDWLPKPIDQLRLRRALEAAIDRPGPRPRILHVEDDLDIVQLTASLLENTADVTHVATRAGAAELLARQAYDLVILDLNLPDGSGAELLPEIRGRCPVIIFSAQDPGSGSGVALAVEASLVKSRTSNEELLEVITRAISRS